MSRNRFSAWALGLCSCLASSVALADVTLVNLSGGSANVGDTVTGTVTINFQPVSPFGTYSLSALQLDLNLDTNYLAFRAQDFAASTISYTGTTSAYGTANTPIALSSLLDGGTGSPFVASSSSTTGLGTNHIASLWSAAFNTDSNIPLDDVAGQSLTFNLVFYVVQAGTSQVTFNSQWLDDETLTTQVVVDGNGGTPTLSFDGIGGAVPEPAMALLLGSALFGLTALRRRQGV